MPYTDYIGVTRLKFERDENGTRPPPVYVKPTSRAIRLSSNEKELIHTNIAKARDSIDQAVAVLRHGAVGDRSQKIVDDYLQAHPGISLKNLAEYSEEIADKLYTDRINISVVDQMYAGDKSPTKYQRARHRRATGRVLYSMNSDILNLQMTRSSISNSDGARNILGTVASSIRPIGSRVAVSDYIQFLDALHNANMRDAQDGVRGHKLPFSGRQDDAPLYIASAGTKERERSPLETDKPRRFSRTSGTNPPPYDSKPLERSFSPTPPTAPIAQTEKLVTDYELNKWYEKQLEFAQTEDDLNAIDKRMEYLRKVEDHVTNLIQMGKNYSQDDRSAIRTSLLADMDAFQRGTLRGQPQAQKEASTSDAIHALINGAAPSGRRFDAGTDHEMTEWYDKLLESAKDEKDLNAIDKKAEDHREVDEQLGKLYEKRDEYSEEDRKAITKALLEGTDKVQRRALYRGLQERERVRTASR